MSICFIDLSKKTTSLNQKLYPVLCFFLSNCESYYPDFNLWLRKVFSELNQGSRRILYYYEEKSFSNPVAVSIIKLSKVEPKICTLYVSANYRKKGIASDLLKKSMQILGENKPLLSLDSSLYSEYEPLFKKFNFRIYNQIENFYRVGSTEIFINRGNIYKDALLSIRPEFSEKIFKGEKSVEFRKVCFSESTQNIYVYTSHPISAITGKFKVKRIEKDQPYLIWRNYYPYGGISNEEFKKYTNNKKEIYAVLIDSAVRFEKSLKLDNIFDTKIYVPQNYRYLYPSMVGKIEHML